MDKYVWPLCEDAEVNMLWLPARAPWFNPIEWFNGWLEQTVAAFIAQGKGSGRNMVASIHGALAWKADGMVDRCNGWIGYLFPKKG